MQLATNGNNVLKTSSLSVAGKLDLNDNDLIVDYTRRQRRRRRSASS